MQYIEKDYFIIIFSLLCMHHMFSVFVNICVFCNRIGLWTISDHLKRTNVSYVLKKNPLW